jgi:hypothetical protein
MSVSSVKRVASLPCRDLGLPAPAAGRRGRLPTLLAGAGLLAGALLAGPAAAAPVTTHPRLWFGAADLQPLRDKAVPANPMFAQGLKPALDLAVTTYDTRLFPGGQPSPTLLTWDSGGTAFTTAPLEAYAEFFAFMSLVDGDPTARVLHAQRARTLLVYVAQQADLGHAAGKPYRDAGFATSDRSRWWGEGFGLAVDWIHDAADAGGNLILTAADRVLLRRVFLAWAADDLTGYMHPAPVGVTNHPALLAGGARVAASNYYGAHARNLILMSLALDPAEDPPVDPTRPAAQLGNTLRSYLDDALGAWLYQQYALYERSDVVGPAYGLPPAAWGALGDGSGGMPLEGFLYGGESLAYVREALLALQTAGYADPTLAGPQAALGASAFWDRYVDGFLHTLAPAPVVLTATQGPVFPVAAYGDVQRVYASYDSADFFGALGLYDLHAGNTQRLQQSRWVVTNVIEGGPAQVYHRVANLWPNAFVSQGILTFAMFDPAQSPAAVPDPRPALPTTFTDDALGRLLSRTDWTPNAAWFDYKCSFATINHQGADCNRFQLYRRGEWLTREHSSYDAGNVGIGSAYHNTLALQNDPLPGLTTGYDLGMATSGSQWRDGMSAGDPTAVTSTGSGYAFAEGDATNLYNHPNPWTPSLNATGILHASRSLVWLAPDYVVVYDRATSASAGRFKRFNLELSTNPAITGHLAVETLPSGQRLFVQSLLPAAATVTAAPIPLMNYSADGEPTQFRLVVEDPSNPTDVRFLHVLQGADAAQPMDAAAALQSLDGLFEGAVVHGVAVLFPHTLGAPSAGTRYVVPVGVDAHVVTGLVPDAGYDVSLQADPGGILVTVSAGGAYFTDAAGVLSVNPGGMITGLTPPSLTAPAAGGAGQLSVAALDDVAWSAGSGASWITLLGLTAGSGDGVVAYQAAPNPAGASRTGTIHVGAQTFTLAQSGVGCAPAPIASAAGLGAGAGSGSVGVSAASGCPWTASSNASWITVSSGASGNGAGVVTYAAQANTGATRTGTLTIAGRAFTVTQAAPSCSYALSVARKLVAAAASSKGVSVTTTSGCGWSVASDSAWLTATPASGAGNGAVTFAAATNPAATSRTGNLTLGGQTMSVVQAGNAGAGCVFAFGTDAAPVFASSATVAHGGGSGSVPVSAPGSCGWTAVSNVPWITISAGGSCASGGGTVQYSVAASSGASRVGTLTIAGMTFTVTQL